MQNTDPNLVRNAKPSDFDKIPIQDREDCMMLHGPRIVTVKKEQLVFYDIIVHSEKNTAFSLCRFNDKEEARKRFNEYKSHIPIMMAIDRDLCLLVKIFCKLGILSNLENSNFENNMCYLVCLVRFQKF